MIEKRIVKATCSFCKESDTACLHSNGNLVCVKCIHSISQAMNIIDEGDIRCLACGNRGGFVAHFDKAKVFLKKIGLDDDGFTVYDVETVIGNWTKFEIPRRFVCDYCFKPIPSWMITQNSYALKWFPALDKNEP